MSKRKVKRCPFCGGDPTLAAINGKNGAFLFIKCPYCRAQAGTFGFIDDGSPLEDNKSFQDAIDRAVFAWNKREDGASDEVHH